MIKIKNLSIKFQEENLFDNFNLTVNKGDKIAIIGKSGIGKSTLLNLLVGFIPEYTGQITINDILLEASSIDKIRQLTAWLPQEISLKFNTVEELFYAPFKFVNNKIQRPSKEEIVALFDTFELSPHLLSKGIKEISGGQKQRIILASCLLLHKPILLLDEPTSALDKSLKQKIADYILHIKDLTVIAVTHEDYWTNNSNKIVHLN